VTAVAADSRLSDALRRTAGHWGLALAVAVLGLVLLWAALPGLFAGGDPTAVKPADKLLPPSAEHWFGTDQLGRDLYTRIVYGARVSLSAAALAVAVGVVVGSLLGAIAGWCGGIVDTATMRLIDVVLSIPGLLLAITIVALLGFGILQAAIAVGLTSASTFARLIRSEVLSAKASSYVDAAITSGASSLAILRRHAIPNAIAPTLALATVQFGIAIVWIASLSFLGLGAQPPDPEWGRLVADGRSVIATRGWLTLYPCLTIVAVVLAANCVSRRMTARREAP
jgi:peptide/nickel transport system permease protein